MSGINRSDKPGDSSARTCCGKQAASVAIAANVAAKNLMRREFMSQPFPTAFGQRRLAAHRNRLALLGLPDAVQCAIGTDQPLSVARRRRSAEDLIARRVKPVAS